MMDITTLFNAEDLGDAFDIGDLSKVWQDSGATTPAIVGGTVSRVDGQVNGNSIIFTDAPTLRQAANGKHYLEFNGTTNTGGCTGIFGGTSAITLTVAEAATTVDNDAGVGLYDGTSSDSSGFLMWRNGSSRLVYRTGATDGDYDIESNTPFRRVSIRDSANVFDYINSVERIASTAALAATKDTFTFGFSTFFVDGQWYGGLAINRAITADERTLVVEPWLSQLMYAIPSTGYHIVPLLGQSNMAGNADIVPGIDDDYTETGDAYQLEYASKTISQATNPLEHIAVNAGDMGPWRTFFIQMANDGRFTKPVLFVPVSKGGTGFNSGDWVPGGPVFQGALDRIGSALTLHEDNDLMGCLWLQGEQDATLGNANYTDDWTAMHASFVSRMHSMKNETPWVLIKIQGGNADNIPAINASLQAAADALPAGTTVETDDLALQGDNLHFTAESLRTIGVRSAMALASLIAPSSSTLARGIAKKLSSSSLTRQLTRSL